MESLRAAIGYAAGEAGDGIAYVRLTRAQGAPRILRVAFKATSQAGLHGLDVSYAAMTAISEALLRKGCERVSFSVDEPRLVDALCKRGDVPPPLILPYVRLRCALNRFKTFEVGALPQSDADLAARACSEVAMHVAA